MDESGTKQLKYSDSADLSVYSDLKKQNSI